MFILLTISVVITLIYVTVVLISMLGFNRIKSKDISSAPLEQKISVIIAARNEEHSIKKCLHSLLNQDYNLENFEIIVVDDHSDDSTFKTLNTIKSENIKVSSLPEGITSKKQALKFGIDCAAHNIIAVTDADCELPLNWLETISSSLNGETRMLLGPVVFGKRKGFLNAFQQLDMLAMQAFEFGLIAFNKPILNNGANLSFTKEAYTKVDGYDCYKTPSGDDVFLLEKFKNEEFEVKGVLNKNFIVETSPTKTLNEFINQRLRWASKSKFYSNKFLQFVSIIVLLQNMVSLFIYSQVLLIEKFALISAILLLTKWLIDFILLFLVAAFFDRKKAILYFISVQLIYPFYIMVIGFASFIVKFEWKGRKY